MWAYFNMPKLTVDGASLLALADESREKTAENRAYAKSILKWINNGRWEIIASVPVSASWESLRFESCGTADWGRQTELSVRCAGEFDFFNQWKESAAPSLEL